MAALLWWRWSALAFAVGAGMGGFIAACVPNKASDTPAAATPPPPARSAAPTVTEEPPGVSPSADAEPSAATSPSSKPAESDPRQTAYSGATTDLTSLRLAEATGGVVTDIAGMPSEERQRGLALGDPATSVSRVAHLSRTASAREDLPVLVDAALTRLGVTVKGPPGLKVRVLDPEKKTHPPSAQRAGRIDFSIGAPAPGSWHVEVTGAKGRSIEVEVQGQSSLRTRVKVKRAGGRPGHRGWFAMHGRPTYGERYLFEADLKAHGQAGAVSEVKIGLLASDGGRRWLTTAPYQSLTLSGSGWIAEGEFKPGEQLVIAGVLPNQQPFERLVAFPAPSPLRVLPEKPGGDRDERVIVPTRWRAFPLRVSLHGPRSNVQVSLTPSGGVEARAEPAQVNLESGAEAHIIVYVRAKPGVPVPPASEFVVVHAQRHAKDTEGNTLTLKVLAGADSDKDGISDDAERERGADYDGDQDGVPDHRQAEVAVLRDGLQAFSLRFSPSAVLESAEQRSIVYPTGIAVPYGAWQLALRDASTVPKALSLYTTARGLSPLEWLLVFDPTTDTWTKRAGYDEKRGVFQLQLNDAERDLLAEGELLIAPAHPR